MDCCNDRVFVDKMERLFLMSSSPLDENPPEKREELVQLNPTSEIMMQTVHEMSPISKVQQSTVEVPFVIIRKPHQDFQAFGDTDNSISRMDINTTKGSNGLIVDGTLSTPALKLVVDRLQFLDDNLRQIEEVVAENGNLMELIQSKQEDKDINGNFPAFENGDGYYSQETLECITTEEGDQIKFISKSNKLTEAVITDKQVLQTEKYFDSSIVYHQVATTETQDRKDSITKLDDTPDITVIQTKDGTTPELSINDKDEVNENDNITQVAEDIEELGSSDTRETQSEVSICKAPSGIIDEIGIEDSENECSTKTKTTWKNPFHSLTSIETTSDTVQNVLAATICVLVFMCIVDNLSA